MPSPQIENGHLDLANELVDQFCKLNLSPGEWRVLWAILRKTYGWHKKMDRITYSQFEEMTGLDRWNIRRYLNRLLERNIITKTGIGQRLSYGLQKDYSKWQPLSKQTTFTSRPLSKQTTVETIIQTDYGLLSKQTTKPLSKQTTTKAKKETIQKKDIYSQLLDHWNSLGIIQHRNFPKSGKSTFKSALDNLLKDYEPSEIKQTMENYSKILKSDEYYFTHKWTVTDFLIRGFEKFRDWDICSNNYRDRKNKQPSEADRKAQERAKLAEHYGNGND